MSALKPEQEVGFKFAPLFTTESPDATLQTTFHDLNHRLHWDEVTADLQKAEVDGLCYFRVILRKNQSTSSSSCTTFAGWPPGSPKKISRSNSQEKRAYFVRHWIRATRPGPDTNNARAKAPAGTPLSTPAPSSYMAMATDGARLILRTPIDRPLDLSETFYSHDFGTWMFHVARIDAVLSTLPNVRIALSIERTISPQERRYIETLNPDKLLQHPPPPPVVPLQRMKGAGYKAPLKVPPTVPPTAPLKAVRPIAVAGRVSSGGASASGGASPAVIRPRVRANGSNGSGNGNGRAGSVSAASGAGNSQMSSWEEEFSAGYYKPLFVCEDQEFDRKAETAWVVSDPRGGNPVEEHWRLRNMQGSTIPEWMGDEGKRVGGSGDVGDDDIIVLEEPCDGINHRLKRAMRAAVDYNAELESGRKDMKDWYVEDSKMEDLRRKTTRETDEAESSSDL